MAKRTADDSRFEDRLRAYLRESMERRGIGVTECARLLGFDQGYVSKWLLRGRGDRGVSALFAYRMTRVFPIDPDHLFNRDPPPQYWRTYVPRPSAPVYKTPPPHREMTVHDGEDHE